MHPVLQQLLGSQDLSRASRSLRTQFLQDTTRLSVQLWPRRPPPQVDQDRQLMQSLVPKLPALRHLRVRAGSHAELLKALEGLLQCEGFGGRPASFLLVSRKPLDEDDEEDVDEDDPYGGEGAWELHATLETVSEPWCSVGAC